MKSDEFVSLNYDLAMAGLDLVVEGHLRPDRADMYEPLTRRFIERLLDQLEALGRPASQSEHIYVLRAIQHYHDRNFAGAVDNGWRAVKSGNVPLVGALEEPDFSVSLRDKLGNANDQ